MNWRYAAAAAETAAYILFFYIFPLFIASFICLHRRAGETVNVLAVTTTVRLAKQSDSALPG